MKITANESALLHFIVDNPSTFNFDEIDLDKEFGEQRWECDDAWYGYPELASFCAKTGMKMEAAKAVLGSLNKKGFVLIDPEDGFVVVGAAEFHCIREALR